ncbi:MAG: helix-turn-helix domain-containing protein [Rhodobacteraceae bacterium]|nr:helix-turn-helix domain-containing protein [Paracoccaceae bacterium]
MDLNWEESQFQERRRVAQRLRELRLARGMTQSELSRRIGLAHPSSISSIERCRRPIYQEELPILAAALECSVKDLLPETRDTSSRYPVPRGKRMLSLVTLAILFQFFAEGVQAEEHESSHRPFFDQVPSQDGPFISEPILPGGIGQPQPPMPPIWGDNCDPTLSMTRDPIVG